MSDQPQSLLSLNQPDAQNKIIEGLVQQQQKIGIGEGYKPEVNNNLNEYEQKIQSKPQESLMMQERQIPIADQIFINQINKVQGEQMGEQNRHQNKQLTIKKEIQTLSFQWFTKQFKNTLIQQQINTKIILSLFIYPEYCLAVAYNKLMRIGRRTDNYHKRYYSHLNDIISMQLSGINVLLAGMQLLDHQSIDIQSYIDYITTQIKSSLTSFPNQQISNIYIQQTQNMKEFLEMPSAYNLKIKFSQKTIQLQQRAVFMVQLLNFFYSYEPKDVYPQVYYCGVRFYQYLIYQTFKTDRIIEQLKLECYTIQQNIILLLRNSLFNIMFLLLAYLENRLYFSNTQFLYEDVKELTQMYLKYGEYLSFHIVQYCRFMNFNQQTFKYINFDIQQNLLLQDREKQQNNNYQIQLDDMSSSQGQSSSIDSSVGVSTSDQNEQQQKRNFVLQVKNMFNKLKTGNHDSKKIVQNLRKKITQGTILMKDLNMEVMSLREQRKKYYHDFIQYKLALAHLGYSLQKRTNYSIKDCKQIVDSIKLIQSIKLNQNKQFCLSIVSFNYEPFLNQTQKGFRLDIRSLQYYNKMYKADQASKQLMIDVGDIQKLKKASNPKQFDKPRYLFKNKYEIFLDKFLAKSKKHKLLIAEIKAISLPLLQQSLLDIDINKDNYQQQWLLKLAGNIQNIFPRQMFLNPTLLQQIVDIILQHQSKNGFLIKVVQNLKGIQGYNLSQILLKVSDKIFSQDIVNVIKQKIEQNGQVMKNYKNFGQTTYKMPYLMNQKKIDFNSNIFYEKKIQSLEQRLYKTKIMASQPPIKTYSDDDKIKWMRNSLLNQKFEQPQNKELLASLLEYLLEQQQFDTALIKFHNMSQHPQEVRTYFQKRLQKLKNKQYTQHTKEKIKQKSNINNWIINYMQQVCNQNNVYKRFIFAKNKYNAEIEYIQGHLNQIGQLLDHKQLNSQKRKSLQSLKQLYLFQLQKRRRYTAEMQLQLQNVQRKILQFINKLHQKVANNDLFYPNNYSNPGELQKKLEQFIKASMLKRKGQLRDNPNIKLDPIRDQQFIDFEKQMENSLQLIEKKYLVLSRDFQELIPLDLKAKIKQNPREMLQKIQQSKYKYEKKAVENQKKIANLNAYQKQLNCIMKRNYQASALTHHLLIGFEKLFQILQQHANRPHFKQHVLFKAFAKANRQFQDFGIGIWDKINKTKDICHLKEHTKKDREDIRDIYIKIMKQYKHPPGQISKYIGQFQRQVIFKHHQSFSQ